MLLVLSLGLAIASFSFSWQQRTRYEHAYSTNMVREMELKHTREKMEKMERLTEITAEKQLRHEAIADSLRLILIKCEK